MSSVRLVVVEMFVILVCGSVFAMPAAAQLPTGPAIGPSAQQSYPYPSANPPVAYPSTYPSTHAVAATPYASMASVDPSMPYPSTNPPAAYPTASAAAAEPIMPYNTAMPAYGSADATSMAQTPSNSEPLYVPYSSSDSAMADSAMAGYPMDANDYVEQAMVGSDECWMWQILPAGLIYKSYLAGNRQSRIGSQLTRDRILGWVWDSTLGAKIGLLRYGTTNDFWPQGWQLDFDGAAFPRVSLEDDRDLVACDYRIGMPLTYRKGRLEMSLGYYHYCSHIGDEYVLQHPNFNRINYVRESIVLGLGAYLNPNLRLYWESSWAFYTDGQARPWKFQFGADFCTNEPTGAAGAPFFAINGHLHEETDFSGSMTVQTGWMWRGCSGRMFRFGMQYFNGLSDQAQFYRTFEEQIGAGLWYDF